MKNIVFTFLILFSFHFSFSQGANEIITITEFVDGKFKLRWMPTTYSLWQDGIKHGYKIERIEDATQTKVILVQNLKPISNEEFGLQFQNNTAANSAKMMLYDTTLNVAPEQSTNLSDVVEKREQNEGKHLFAMIAAENDFEVAKAMGMGYEDDQMDTNLTYTYVISIDDEDVMSSIPPSYGFSDFSGSILKAVSSLETNLDQDRAVLTWDVKEFERVYSAWNIERSFDGLQFEKVNETPFMHGYTEDIYEFIASYQDLLIDCTGEVYYRVQGITPFGTAGPYSNETEVSCVKDLIRIPFAINGSQEKDEDILVNWWTFDALYEDSIQGFNIYRTAEMTKPLVKLNNQLLDKSKREYLDTDAIPSGYYILEIIDINDVPQRSAEFFVQRKDDVPPSIPTGLAGKFVSEQTLELRWQRNSEPDFKGCDIMIANDRNANFIKKNLEYIEGNTFAIGFNEQVVTDSVYVQIRSVDIFYNPSEYSEIYAFARPDVWAPAKPILEFAYPTPEGVALGWSYSGSDDVVKHKIQRKYSNDYQWKDILIVSKNNIENFQQNKPVAFNDSNANHIDNYDLVSREYDYRIVAYDAARNSSRSKVLSLVPFASQQSDVIKNFKVQIFSQDVAPSAEMINQLNNLNSPQVDEQIESLTKESIKANLSWSVELNENIEGFIIYRSMPKEGFKPIKECRLGEALGIEDYEVDINGSQGRTQAGFLDENLKSGYRYSYYVVAKFRNGSESDRSDIISKTIR